METGLQACQGLEEGSAAVLIQDPLDFNVNVLRVWRWILSVNPKSSEAVVMKLWICTVLVYKSHANPYML